MMEPMLSCEDVMDRLWEYLDGELDPDTAGKIEQHLDACSLCYPQYDFRRAFQSLVAQAGEGPVPPGLRRKVFEALLEEDALAVGGGGSGSGGDAGWWARLKRRLGR
jgi:anti-sigma factor (TIGR02949 family)